MNTHPQIDLHVVTGPPAAGKSTFVAEHAPPGAVVIDMDALAEALGSPHSHNHPEPIRNVTRAVFNAAHDTALAQPGPVWIIRSVIPSWLQPIYAKRGTIHTLCPPRGVVLKRLRDQDRDLESLQWVLGQWYRSSVERVSRNG